MAEGQLKRTLTPLMLWGLGVGYVISGMYFGWNLGLAEGGTLGLGIATFFIVILYVAFTLSYAELAISIPRAGGAFDYARRAFGPDLGFITGIAQNVEFVFAPPAIAFAIGAYFHLFLPSIPVIAISIGSYVLFTALNIYGVRAAAVFELIITFFAVGELLLFAAITLPEFHWSNITRNSFPNGLEGAFAATPFAIWFFLAIEGVANLAEEAINPKRTLLLGFGSAIITLVVLCVITFFSSIGVAGWEAIVYSTSGDATDSPLPLALAKVVSTDDVYYHLLITVGLFGLVASFHGIILAAGRATYEFGRVKFAPYFLGEVHPRFQTPSKALLFNMVLGVIALLTGKTAEIITIAVFGALTLYIFSMLALFRLRRSEPKLMRPYRVPLYPWLPAIALGISLFSFAAMVYYNFILFLIYFSIMVFCFGLFKLRRRYKGEVPLETENI